MKKQRKKSDLLIDNPIDILAIVFGLIGLLVLFYLRVKYTGSVDYPTISDDAATLLLKGIIGLSIILAIRLFWGKETVNFAGFVRTPIEYFLYAIGCYFVIQILIILISSAGIFQVEVADVYAFYISAAVIEELIYRGALVMGVQFLIAKVIEEYKYPNLWLSTIISALISGLVFAAVHTRYWNSPVNLLITFLGGVSQAVWYQYTKNLSVPIFAHVIVNFVASGSLLQTLG